MHTNSEFAAQVSNHDPQLAQLGIDESPTNKDKGRYVLRVATSANDRFAAGSSPTFHVRNR